MHIVQLTIVRLEIQLLYHLHCWYPQPDACMMGRTSLAVAGCSGHPLFCAILVSRYGGLKGEARAWMRGPHAENFALNSIAYA